MSDVVLEAWHGVVPPRHDRRRGGLLTAASSCVALGITIALLVLAARMLPPPAPAARSLSPATLLPWREILKPVRIYSLQAAAFAGAPTMYTARAHAPGGGREDVLTFGQFDGVRSALRLRIFRRSTEAPGRATLQEALSSEAADLGVAIVRFGHPDAVPTRLGRFEVADVEAHRASGAERPCVGFRLALDKPAMAITGLACGRNGAQLSRTDVGCLLERLDVASARDDRELIDFFAASELRRNAACAGMRLGPDGLHAPWLDEKPVSPRATPKVVGGKPATSRQSLRRH